MRPGGNEDDRAYTNHYWYSDRPSLWRVMTCLLCGYSEMENAIVYRTCIKREPEGLEPEGLHYDDCDD